MTKSEDLDEALLVGINPDVFKIQNLQKQNVDLQPPAPPPPLLTPEPEMELEANSKLAIEWCSEDQNQQQTPPKSQTQTPEPPRRSWLKPRTKSFLQSKLAKSPPEPELNSSSLLKTPSEPKTTASAQRSTRQRTKQRPQSERKVATVRSKRPKLEPKSDDEVVNSSTEKDKQEPKEGTKYNLRSKKPTFAKDLVSKTNETISKQVEIKTTPATTPRPSKRKAFPFTNRISKKSKHSFQNSILSTIDTNTYHQLADNNAHARELIRLSNKSIKSQLERFVYEDKSFVAITWLTVARIFEYNNDSGLYSEVKRIPERFVSLSPNLITAIHYTDLKFYLARLEGGKEDKPFIEVRDIFGKLLDGPVQYEHSIQSIYSDDKYLYVKTSNQTIYIHRKNLFKLAYYKVNYSLFTSGPLVASWVEESESKSNTKLTLLTATTQEIVLSNYNIFSHKITQCYRFEGKYKIVSIDRIDSLIIIHRNMLDDDSKYRSKIELGFLALTKNAPRRMFIHESTINIVSKIIQIKVHRNHLYLLGCLEDPVDGSNCFQIGCIYLPGLRPMWVTNVRASFNSHILPHDDNVAIIRESQQMTSIKTDIDKKISECKKCKLRFLSQKDKNIHEKQQLTILSKLSMRKNELLLDLGIGVLRAIPPKEN